MEELVGLLNRAGVRTALCTHLPKGCRGVHTGTKKGSYLIEYDAFDWERAQEHTVLHEALRDRQGEATRPVPQRRQTTGQESVPSGGPLRRRRR